MKAPPRPSAARVPNVFELVRPRGVAVVHGSAPPAQRLPRVNLRPKAFGRSSNAYCLAK